jgi:hypothetical protein
MRRFLGNLLWIICALPFYVIALFMCAYVFIVLKSIGFIFDKTKPYNIINKIDDYIYNQVKKYLIA